MGKLLFCPQRLRPALAQILAAFGGQDLPNTTMLAC